MEPTAARGPHERREDPSGRPAPWAARRQRHGGSTRPSHPHLTQTGRHHRYRRAGVSARRVVALFAVAALLILVVAGGLAALRLTGNLTSSPLNLSDGAEGDDKGPLDILVMGSDTRHGQGNDDRSYGSEDDSEGLTDVMMLVHVTEDRDAVTVISFPRDLVVDIPRCTDPHTGQVHEAETGMLNSAIKNGGPGCTVAAVNAIAGVDVDHFMLADFNAVKELSSTVGGVQVCVNQDVDDPKSGLRLPAGISSVEGDQALAFLRSRAAFGNGGDESRIRSQQAFLASLTRKMKAEGTLENLPQLYRLAEVMTQNLHVDEALTSIPRLVRMGTTLAGVDLSNIAFVTIPTRTHPEDPNRLVVDEEPADRLFGTLQEDVALTGDEPGGTASPQHGSTDPTDPANATGPADTGRAPGASGSPTAPETPAGPTATAPAVPAGDVPVTVANHTETEGRDRQLVKVLRKAGYTQARKAPSGEPLAATQIFYHPSWGAGAQEVARQLNIADSQLVPTYTVPGVQVSVGEDFTSGDRFEISRSLPEEYRGQTAEQFTCQDSFEG